ncbi:unnamed protein product [Polarella glacialis]|uniref:Uncharacterized protein n=1 Tax=Polarella glacialis TaxID=89957 RepID=A0A813J0C0_POLGL|nr:unnamed protein product [Polarella glacialis]
MAAAAAAAAALAEESAASSGFHARLASLDTGGLAGGQDLPVAGEAAAAANQEEKAASAAFHQRLSKMAAGGQEKPNSKGADESDSGSSYSGSGSPSRGRSRSPPRPALGLGSLVELQGLAKAPELNGRRGLITAGPDAGGRWEVLCFPTEGAGLRRLSVALERLRQVPAAAGSVRLRLRNVPGGYDTDLLREEIEDEGFMDGESFSSLLFDHERGFGYLCAASERLAMQIVGNFDGRRLDRAGPGRLMPDSALAQIVKGNGFNDNVQAPCNSKAGSTDPTLSAHRRSGIIAVMVGSIELLGVLAVTARFHGWFWDGVSKINDNFEVVGIAVIGVFLLSLIIALGCFHRVFPPGQVREEPGRADLLRYLQSGDYIDRSGI